MNCYPLYYCSTQDTRRFLVCGVYSWQTLQLDQGSITAELDSGNRDIYSSWLTRVNLENGDIQLLVSMQTRKFYSIRINGVAEQRCIYSKTTVFATRLGTPMRFTATRPQLYHDCTVDSSFFHSSVPQDMKGRSGSKRQHLRGRRNVVLGERERGDRGTWAAVVEVVGIVSTSSHRIFEGRFDEGM